MVSERNIVRALLNDPNVSSASVLGETPLYTTRVGKFAYRTFAPAILTGYEAARGLRDYAGELIAIRKFTPRESRLIEEGHGVEILMPVTMVQGQEWPGWADRVKAAVKSLEEKGKLGLLRRMPQGKAGKGNELILPVAQAQGLMELFTQGIPVARMTITPDPIELTTRGLVAQGDKSTEEMTRLHPVMNKSLLQRLGIKDAAIEQITEEMLLPRLDVGIQIAVIDAGGKGVKSYKIDFPLGYSYLDFDDYGKVKNPPHRVGDKVYHPALLGLSDLTRIISAVVKERTGNIATIDPGILSEAFAKAKLSGATAGQLLEPHFARMLAVERLSQMITQRPAELVMAVANTIYLTTKDGKNIHPNSAGIMTDFAGKIFGFANQESDSPSPTIWTHFIEAFHRACKAEEALAIWGGAHTAAGNIVYLSGTPYELHAFFEAQLSEKAPIFKEMSEAEYQPKAYPPALLLASAGGPLNLLLDVQAQLLGYEASAHIGRQVNIRRALTAETIIRMAQETTKQYREYVAGMEEGYGEEMGRLPKIGHQLGKKAGDKVLSTYTSGPIPEEDKP